jgi:hypothetical protein
MIRERALKAVLVLVGLLFRLVFIPWRILYGTRISRCIPTI